MMNKLATIAVILATVLLTGTMSSAFALSPAQLKTCMDKMPKNLTNAQKAVYKKKCNTEQRVSGTVPPGFRPSAAFNEADLVMLCISLKLYPQKDRDKTFDEMVKISKGNGYYKYCEIMWKDKIWSGKKFQKNDIIKVLQHYGKAYGAFTP